jgi:hypothetical protein
MIRTEKLDTRSRSQVSRFVDLPFRLYRKHPQWVPPLRRDVILALNRSKHPFYEQSDAEFFIACKNDRDVGRIAVLDNRPYNAHHATRQADFCFFDCEEDFEAARALFGCARDWARSRGLDRLVGPKGLTPLDPYGILIDGFEQRQMMTMVNYNYPYYSGLVEGFGFRKEVDFVSCRLSRDTFRMPDRIRRIAGRVMERGGLRVLKFRDRRELLAWAPRIGQAYNKAFVRNWEYCPLTDAEVGFLVKSLVQVADPRLIKIIVHGEDAVGFLFTFPDISAALQRMRGRLFPFGPLYLMLEFRRTRWLALNGAGILPEFQGRGGNALLYTELEKTVRESGYQHGHLTQIAETAVQMRRDLEELGAVPIKNHRVYALDL